MPQANREAVCCPISALKIANLSQGETEIVAFSELVKMVGQTKEPFGDQM